MSVNFFIGHRGSGKSNLLKRVSHYLPQSICIDLDELIENDLGMNISQFFSTQDEDAFRELEKKHFNKLISQLNFEKEYYIALGAGFNLNFLSDLKIKNEIFWIRRFNDQQNKVFLDRPILKNYSERLLERTKNYAAVADQQLYLSEGNFDTESEKNYFLNQIDTQGASITLLPSNFKNFKTWIQKRLSWNLKYFEVRDDLLNQNQIEQAFELIPKNMILFSYRKKENSRFDLPLKMNLKTDWPLEWGEPSFEATFVSLHQVKSLDEDLKKLSARKEKVKLACNINHFEDLYKCHQWVTCNLEKQSFLPQGPLGQWYRLFMKSKMEINFIRENDGSSQAQPTLLQWLNTKKCEGAFAAVLGKPIEHSYSPLFHQKAAPFYAISVSEDSFDTGLEILKKMGLKKAAVTSPLKKLAFMAATKKTNEAIKTKSANTLLINKNDLLAHNTDYLALKNCLKPFAETEQIAIWGGGGVLTSIQEALPQAAAFSASTGEPRQTFELSHFLPQVVIWAASNSSKTQMPPAHWKPEMIFDLNYTDTSLGREYALKTGASYQSGLEMFELQGQEQQNFWNQNERE